MSNLKVIKDGTCKCILEPRGAMGLEGYTYSDSYRYQEMEDLKGQYFRVYLDADSDYYKTCGPNVFKKHFQIQ